MYRYDLFVSYRRKEAGRVLPLVQELQRLQLRVWLDQTAIGDFEPVTDSIRQGIADAKAMLVWFSSDYLRSRPCQMELTAGFIAATRTGDPRQRILVVNPESDAKHIIPLPLADGQHLAVSTPESMATRIAARVMRLEGAMGASMHGRTPAHVGRKLIGAERFVGRTRELWELHSTLVAPDHAILVEKSGPAVAFLSGLGGIGKSLLAEEYALRFGAAYPAGIFWLRADGNDRHTTGEYSDDAQIRGQQLRSLAVALGLKVVDPDPAALSTSLSRELEQRGGAYLWVVDDLRSGLSSEEVRQWLAPSAEGRTLVTTRSREYSKLGTSIPLDVLQPIEAVELLTRDRKPSGQPEMVAAHGIVQDLGYHPLAVEVASAALAADEGLRGFVQFREALLNPVADELELAAELVETLPSGHEANVASTLLRSVRALGPEALDFLRLAASLAVAPIPPKLVVQVFARLDGLDDPRALARARLALLQTERASLSQKKDEGNALVHALVSRVVRFRDPHLHRREQILMIALEVLRSTLVAAADIRAHTELAPYVVHARQLVGGELGDPVMASVAGWIARFDFERGNYIESESLARRRLAACTAWWGELHAETLLAKGDLTRALQAQGRTQQARVLAEEVAEGRGSLLGAEHPDTLTALNNLAGILHATGELRRAAETHLRVLEIRRRILGPDHEHTLFSVNNLGTALAALGDHQEARGCLEEVLESRTRLLGASHPDTLSSRASLGQLLFEMGDKDAALHELRETYRLRVQTLKETHPSTAFTAASLARALIATGHLEEAETLLRPALHHCRDALGGSHPTCCLLANNLGKSLAKQARPAEARPLYEEALEGQTQIAGARDQFTMKFAANLTETLLALGDNERANLIFEQYLRWLVAESPPADQRPERELFEQAITLQEAIQQPQS